MLRDIVLEKFGINLIYINIPFFLKIIFIVDFSIIVDFLNIYGKYFFPMIIHMIDQTNIFMRITQYWKRS